MDAAYYTVKQPNSFTSATGLQRQTKQPIKRVRKWLSEQDAYTLHKPIVRKFKRRKTFVKAIDDLWQADIVDLSTLSKSNDGNRYLLVCIDVLSKFAHVASLKTKSATVVRDAFVEMLRNRRPNMLQTDKGTEFINYTFQKLLSDNDIKHYTSENDDIKCAIVERFNRTLLEKIFRYLTWKTLIDMWISYKISYRLTTLLIIAV